MDREGGASHGKRRGGARSGGSEAEVLSRDEFVLYKSVYGDFSDSPVTGVGQRARLYFNDARDLAAVCLTTYANKLNDYYDGVLDPESCVYSFSIRRKATDGAHGPLSQVTNFDGTGNAGVPMVACLEVSEPDAYVGNSPYEFSTTLRYRTPCYVGTVNPTVTYTYTDVEDAVGSTTITID